MDTESSPGQTARPPEKTFVSDNGSASIACPACGATKTVAVAQLCGKKHTVKANCRCSHTFLVQLEFRRHYRKNTELKGTYRLTSGESGGGPAVIRNISRGGIGFTVSGIHNIKIGQRAVVDFVLDNRKQSRMHKEVVIRSIAGNRIGCEYTKQQAFEKDLGFYLRP